MTGARALVVLFIGISIVVTTVWLLIAILNPVDAPDLTLAMTAIITGCVTLASKAHNAA